MFQTLPLDVQRDLRKRVRDHGVYVPISHNTSIPTTLFRVLSENLDWPFGIRPPHIPPTQMFGTSNHPNVLQIQDSNATRRSNSHSSGNRSVALSPSYAISSMM